jgi:hypothetical protein
MLQKCVALDPAYTPAYLVLARMASGSTTGSLLRHVVRLQPKSPDYVAEYAAWLYQNGKRMVINRGTRSSMDGLYTSYMVRYSDSRIRLSDYGYCNNKRLVRLKSQK